MKLLVVVDMQNDFINGSLGTKEAEAIVDNVADYIESFNGDIILTQDTHYNDYLRTPEGKKLPIPHCIAGTMGRDLHYRIIDVTRRKQEDHKVGIVSKNTFGSMDLPTKINISEFGEHHYDEIYVCGLCTDICVVSNAILLRAAMPNATIKCNSALCAGTTRRNHKAAIAVMRSCQIEILRDERED